MERGFRGEVMNDIKTRKDIELLIRAFYKKVLADDLIAHFFTEVVPVDWETHFPTMFDFWESVIFEKPTYSSNAMQKHVDLHRKAPLKKVHFERWLELFNNTVQELFTGPKAELAMQRAQSIATVIQIKTF